MTNEEQYALAKHRQLRDNSERIRVKKLNDSNCKKEVKFYRLPTVDRYGQTYLQVRPIFKSTGIIEQ